MLWAYFIYLERIVFDIGAVENVLERSLHKYVLLRETIIDDILILQRR